MTGDRVAALLAEGKGISEVASTLALSKSTVCYHARKLGYQPDPRFGVRYDWEAVRAYYDAGHTAAECRAMFGFGSSAWSDAIHRGDVKPRPRGRSLASYLGEKRSVVRGGLKRRLIAEGIKRNACERCGVTEWRGRPLPLALHHINGDGLDNRLENLRLLCPNCHSQTENYGGRNVGRSQAVTSC